MIAPLDLVKLFGHKYRIEYEESWYADPSPKNHGDKRWLAIIPCKHGHVYVHSDTHLGFASKRYGAVAKQLASLCQVTQDGDKFDGVNVIFPVAAFPGVAALVRPRRRPPKLSPERRAQLVDMGAQHRFPPGVNRRFPGSKTSAGGQGG